MLAVMLWKPFVAVFVLAMALSAAIVRRTACGTARAEPEITKE
jgi:hypothetical protein